jgi:3'-5' exonuclease
MEIFIDIETIPAQNADVIEAVKKRARKRNLNEDDEVTRTSLDASAGEIVVIGVAVGDADPVSMSRNLGESERDMLVRFSDTLSKKSGAMLIGHNILGFDRKFIRQRALVHQVRMPAIITRDIKPWEDDVVRDTMRMWCGSSGTVSLDALAIAFGVKGKGEIDGADVWGMVRDGRIEEVCAYCRDDVRMTRDVYRHMTKTV